MLPLPRALPRPASVILTSACARGRCGVAQVPLVPNILNPDIIKFVAAALKVTPDGQPRRKDRSGTDGGWLSDMNGISCTIALIVQTAIYHPTNKGLLDNLIQIAQKSEHGKGASFHTGTVANFIQKIVNFLNKDGSSKSERFTAHPL